DRGKSAGAEMRGHGASLASHLSGLLFLLFLPGRRRRPLGRLFLLCLLGRRLFSCLLCSLRCRRSFPGFGGLFGLRFLGYGFLGYGFFGYSFLGFGLFGLGLLG